MDTAALELPRRSATGALLIGLLLALLLAWVVAAPASAGGPGVWSNLSGTTGSNLTEVGLVTTPDGILHVAWIRNASTPGKQDLMYRTVKGSGALGTKRLVESSWSGLNNPAMVYYGGEIGIVFSGMRSINGGEIYDGLTLTHSLDGVTWALRPGGAFDPPGPPVTAAYASPVNAIAAGGQVYTTWYSSYGVWVLRGTAGGAAAHDFQSGLGSYGYYSNFGLGKGGDLWLVWASNATGNYGLWAAPVDQTGGAPGTRQRLAASVTKWSGNWEFDMQTSKVAVTGRPKGTGVFVAYPTGYPSTTKVRLWKLTPLKTTSLVVASGSAEKNQATVAAGADGRIWVAWSQYSGGHERICVRRSNVAATAFGPTKSYAAPKGYLSVYHLAAVVRGGKLDVLAHMGNMTGESTWHIQFKAPV
jgi:hypothetical protein